MSHPHVPRLLTRVRDCGALDLINKMPLFGKASKSPVELVRVLKESLLVLEKGTDGKKQGT